MGTLAQLSAGTGPVPIACGSSFSSPPPPHPSRPVVEKKKLWANTAVWWIFETQVGLSEGRPAQDLQEWREVD